MEISQTNLLRIYQKTNGHCFYCGSLNASQIDHFVAKKVYQNFGISKEEVDPDRLENLFLVCQKCNLKKKDKSIPEFSENSNKMWRRYLRTNRRIIEFAGSEKEIVYQ